GCRRSKPAAQSDYSTGAGTGRGVIPCPAGLPCRSLGLGGRGRKVLPSVVLAYLIGQSCLGVALPVTVASLLAQAGGSYPIKHFEMTQRREQREGPEPTPHESRGAGRHSRP